MYTHTPILLYYIFQFFQQILVLCRNVQSFAIIAGNYIGSIIIQETPNICKFTNTFTGK